MRQRRDGWLTRRTYGYAAGTVFVLALASCAGEVARDDQVELAAADEASPLSMDLFDGSTLEGWFVGEPADWRVEDGAIVATRSEGVPSLLLTDDHYEDFELTVEFQAAPDVNSGVFLRTPARPTDPASDCYEVNIAPVEHPFPTGSVVARQRSGALDLSGPSDPDEQTVSDSRATPLRWRQLRMVLSGDRLEVWLDGTQTVRYIDPQPLPAGHIGLQFNSGTVRFRNVQLREVTKPPRRTEG